MKCIHPSLAPEFNERLVGVYSFEAMPMLDDHLSSIQLDGDNPGFLLNWNLLNLAAFVEAANRQPAVNVPWWMQTQPPNITIETFTEDLVLELARVAGGRCGITMLAPNTIEQYGAIGGILMAIQVDTFMQNVGQIALPVVNGVEQHLATTYTLTEPRAQRSRPNTFPSPPAGGLRLFI
ncbi:hypothetical protein DVH05_012868 [Phytophthora capsici]|nr:hypothetical protein DVH05_012868 [Phytophthora capsici]